MNLPRLSVVAISAGFNSNAALLEYQRRNVINILADARNTKGRTDNVRSQFIDSLLVALSATPNDSKEYSLTQQANSLGLKKTAGIRLLKKASKKRKAIEGTGDYRQLQTKYKRKSRYSDSFLKSLSEWATNHPFVRVSPIANDTLLINGTRVPKLLRECPIREMHNDMTKEPTDGGLPGSTMDSKPILSDTELRRQLKTLLPELRKASLRHKKMCGCENCIGISYLHDALNRFRMRTRRRLEEKARTLKEQVRTCTSRHAKKRFQTQYLASFWMLTTSASLYFRMANRCIPNQDTPST